MFQFSSEFPGYSNNSVAKAWEKFVWSEDTPIDSVRNIIGQSWIKSRELGIDPESRRAPTVLTLDEIDEKVKKDDFSRAGAAVLNKLADVLHDSQHVVVLADNEGRILYSVGHSQIREQLEQINFRPGGSWSESVVGPNGVGTPLTIGRPEIVMGHEHYCKGWKPWVCYGAPIFDASNKIIKGSVDITGPVQKINKMAMALAISTSLAIKSDLTIIQSYRRQILREHSAYLQNCWPTEGIIVADENGDIVDYNSNVSRHFDFVDGLGYLNKTLSRLIPGISEIVKNCLTYRLNKEINLNIEKSGSTGNLVKVRFQPVIDKDKCIGVALITSDLSQNAMKKTSKNPVTTKPQSKYLFKDILGKSQELKNVVHMAKLAALDPLYNSVLLIGDTGTGKELLAHSIHAESDRAEGPFIAVNCAAIPKDLIESELFGYVHGAFTGAIKSGLKGKFESAHNGTLFLDEMSSMDLNVQAKLLRALDSMEITRIGSTQPVQVDVRIIAAADKNIFSAVEEGSFRKDLFHRLSVLEIEVPSLAERGKDIVLLAKHFLAVECNSAERAQLYLSDDVINALLNYNWPGNIRELHNICVRWTLTVEGDKISIDDVPNKIRYFKEKTPTNNIEILTDELIKQTIEQTNHNISKAARLLGIDRSTIYRRSRKWL